jgi:hypothetical protein
MLSTQRRIGSAFVPALVFLCLFGSFESTAGAAAQSTANQTIAVQPGGDRIANALEASNAYAQSKDQQREAKRAVQAAADAARWTRWMAIVAVVDTLVTLVGVGLVGLTLREARRSANEATRSANEAVKAFKLANDEFVATHRPRMHLRRAYQVNLQQGHVNASLEFVNRGETDAHIVDIGVDLFPRYPAPEQPAYHALPNPHPLILQPGKNALMNMVGVTSLTAANVSAITLGQAELCLLAIVNYTDSRGLLRSISAFRVYRPEKRRFVHAPADDELAEWDYED